MPHSYVCSLTHCMFGTRDRSSIIDTELEISLWPYMTELAWRNGFRSLAAGGATDHLHLLLSLPSTMNVAKAIQLLKDGSSGWIRDRFTERGSFEWQDGYGAFSVCPSELEPTIAYIQRQKEYHRRKTFCEEFAEFLEENRIRYDPRYLFR